MPNENTASLRALDTLNFCNAGIQTGLGPFMSIFYTAVRHWDPGQIGVLIACQSIAGIALQSVVGNWIDETHHKRSITAAAGVIVGLGAVGIATIPSFAWQIVVQLIIGVAVTVIPAATAAFALGMVGKNELSRRVARNETFTHSGNTAFAIAAGAIGTLLALQGIFYAAAAFAIAMAPAALFIRKEHVNYEAARGGSGENTEAKERSSFRDLFRDKRVIWFTISIVVFYFANAATLPLVGEILTKAQKGRQSAWQIAASVGVAEIVMVVVAMYSGKLADKWGRKPLFLIGFAALALRNALTVFNHNPFYLISLQTIDGVAMAIYGVLLTLITADLAKGTGRFNFLQGAVQSSMGLGGVLSNGLFGFIAKSAGFNASFWGLAAAAVAGGLFCQFMMPETKDQGADGEQKEEQPEEQKETSHAATA